MVIIMEKILTVKVAAYNVEKYIRQCLKPFTDKRYRNKIQIIIVNNKCEDNTLNIIKEFEQQYPTVFKVVAQENEGYASTFNRGFEMAEGKYFTHLDGDDWFDAEELYSFIKFLEKSESDLVVSNVRGVYDKNGQTKNYFFSNVEFGKLYSFDEGYLKSGKIIGSHAITVKTKIIKDNNLTVHLDNFIPEVEYELLIIPHVKTITYTGQYLYNYRTGYAEQASNYNNIKSKCDNIYSAVIMFLDWMNILKGLSKGRYEYLSVRIGNCANVIFYLMLFQKISIKTWKSMLEILCTIEKKNKEVYKSMSIIPKIICKGTPVSYIGAAFMYQQYKKRKKFNF